MIVVKERAEGVVVAEKQDRARRAYDSVKGKRWMGELKVDQR